MADASALFRRHVQGLMEAVDSHELQRGEVTILYAACVIAEALRNGLDETQ